MLNKIKILNLTHIRPHALFMIKCIIYIANISILFIFSCEYYYLPWAYPLPRHVFY
jgi:hypothetical protein